jgi:hypothetical protein
LLARAPPAAALRRLSLQRSPLGLRERFFVHPLAIDAAQRRGLDLEPLEADVPPAFGARPVTAVGHALEGGLERAQLGEVARQFGVVDVGQQVGHRRVAFVGDAARQIGVAFTARLLGVGVQFLLQRGTALLDLTFQRFQLFLGQ